jgi:hypothetical protein
LPFYDNAGDNFTVLAFADGYQQAGFTPVKCSPELPQTLDIMLLKRHATFRFADAQGEKMKTDHASLYALLSDGGADSVGAADRYDNLMEMRAPSLACLLKITTAMTAISLPVGNPLQYFKEVIWDQTMAQDRFYGWADPALYVDSDG